MKQTFSKKIVSVEGVSIFECNVSFNISSLGMVNKNNHQAKWSLSTKSTLKYGDEEKSIMNFWNALREICHRNNYTLLFVQHMLTYLKLLSVIMSLRAMFRGSVNLSSLKYLIRGVD